MMAKKDKSKPKATAKLPPKSREQRQIEKQTLIIWALLANGGQGLARGLKPEVDKSEREALIHLGLLTAERRKQAYWLEVTDRGWRWAEDHLGDELPDRSYAGTFVLRAWLRRLRAFIQGGNLSLADIISPQPIVPGHDDRDQGVKRTSPAATMDYEGLCQRIRKAYLEVTGGRYNTRALLSDIRPKLQGVDRATLDETLKRMEREERASLMQLDNRIEITPADRDAEIQIGREPRHILWIAQ
jgi:hypothetical protein